MAECQHPHAPRALREWVGNPPHWLIIQEAPRWDDSELSRLDAGEAAAIRLAIQHKASLLLMDERKGRRVAQAKGLKVAGGVSGARRSRDRRSAGLQCRLQPTLADDHVSSFRTRLGANSLPPSVRTPKASEAGSVARNSKPAESPTSESPRLSRPAGAPRSVGRLVRWFRCASPPANFFRASGTRRRRGVPGAGECGGQCGR